MTYAKQLEERAATSYDFNGDRLIALAHDQRDRFWTVYITRHHDDLDFEYAEVQLYDNSTLRVDDRSDVERYLGPLKKLRWEAV